MNIYAPIFVGHDSFKLKKVESENSALDFVLDVTIAPRCDQYRSYFRHDSNVTYLTLDGRCLLEVEGETWTIGPMQTFDIPAGKSYRLRANEHRSVKLLAFTRQAQVLAEWKAVGEEVNQSAYTTRDGITRFR